MLIVKRLGLIRVVTTAAIIAAVLIAVAAPIYATG